MEIDHSLIKSNSAWEGPILNERDQSSGTDLAHVLVLTQRNATDTQNRTAQHNLQLAKLMLLS